MAPQQPVYNTLVANRAKYPTPMSNDQIGQLLNETAWACRDQGWGLLLKESGSNCKQPITGTLIARDILTNAQQQILVDVLIDAEGKGTPSWGTEKPLDKPYVAPVDAGGSAVAPPSVTGQQPYPHEGTWWKTFDAEITAIYAEAGKPFPDSPGAYRWGNRTAYDIAAGLPADAAKAKHFDELRIELGL